MTSADGAAQRAAPWEGKDDAMSGSSCAPRHTHTRGERNGQHKLQSAHVIQIRVRDAQGASRAALAHACGVNWSTIDTIVRGHAWAHL